MEATEEPFQRDLQHVEFCDVKLHATIWSGGEGPNELNGKRKDLVYGAVQLELIAFGLNRDVLERGIGRRAGVQIVADVPYVGVDDPFLNLKDEGLWVIEGRIDLPAGANHLSTNPADVDTEVRAFAQEQIEVLLIRSRIPMSLDTTSSRILETCRFESWTPSGSRFG
jgi:hypothetical protein